MIPTLLSKNLSLLATAENTPLGNPKKNTTGLKTLLALFMMVVGMGVSWGQTTVFSDDFTANTSASYIQSGVLNSSQWTVVSGGTLSHDFGARRNTSPAQLDLTNDAGFQGTNQVGWVFAYTSVSNFSSPYNSTLSSNSGLLTWTFNMRQIRTSPSGFSAAANYGMAVVLGGTSTTAATAGNGYAVTIGSTGYIRLVTYTTGLQASQTTLITSASAINDSYASVKVTYSPSNNTWELFTRNDGSTSFTDPTTGTLTSQGNSINNTYTSSALANFGVYWQGSTGATQTAFFDNLRVTLPASLTNYYNVASSDVANVNNWGTSTDGTGTKPTNFTTANQVFNITNTGATMGSGWTVSGTNSKIIVGNGIAACNFTIPALYAVTGTVDVNAGATLTNTNTANPTLGTLNATSTVVFNAAGAQTVPIATYGNLSISNTGSSTATAAGAIGVTTALTVSSGATFDMVTYALSGAALTTSGTGTLKTQSTSATPLPIGRTWSMDVLYNSASGQTVVAGSYANLNLTGGARTLIASGTINISGTYTPGAGTLTVTSNTINFNGADGQTIPAATYNNLTSSNNTRTLANGVIKIASTFTPGSSNYTIGTSTVEFNGSAAQTIPVLPVTSGGNYYNLTYSGSNTGTLGGSVTVAGDMTVSAGTLSANGTSTTRVVNVSGNYVQSGGTFDGGSVNVSSGVTSTINLSGNFSKSSGIFTNSATTTSFTLNFAKTGSQTFSNSGTFTYANININSGSTVTALTIMPNANGALVVTGTLDMDAFQVTNLFASSTATINGTLKTKKVNGLIDATTSSAISSTNTTLTIGASSTIEYNATTTQTVSARTDYANLTLSGGGDKTLGGTSSVSGTLTFTSGNLTIGANTLTLNGAVVNTSGTLTGSSTSNLTIGGTAGTLNFTSGSRALNNLSLGASGIATLGSALDVYGVLGFTAGGSLNMNAQAVTLKSTSTSTARVNDLTGSTLTGASNVTVERYIPAKRAWRALTAPLVGSTNSSVYYNWQNNGTTIANTGVEIWSNASTDASVTNAGLSSSLLSYNSSSNTWTAITNTVSASLFSSSMNNPFMVFVTGPYASTSTNITNLNTFATTLKATGTLLTGNQTYATTAGKYSFIGNPYASPLDLSVMMNNTQNATASFGGNVWVWDANASGRNTVGTYNLYTSGTYTNLTSNPVVTAGTQIQSGQAFFVKSTDGATFTIKESHKGSAFSNAVFKTGTLPELLRVGLYKQVNNEWSGRDGAMTVILADADANQASNKMANGTENIAFTKNGASFASNHQLPLVASDVLNVKVWNTTVGANYKLKINTEEFSATNLEATLEDLFTNVRTPLTLDGTAVEYPFTVTADAMSTGNRFRIVFQTSALGTTIPKANGFSIVPNPVTGDSFQVNLGSLGTGTYSYSICNTIGQEVEKGSIDTTSQNTNYTIKMNNSATGIYIMKIKGSDNSVFTAKIIKK